LVAVGGCETIPSAGPTAEDITAASRPLKNGETRFALVDVNPAIVSAMENWTVVSLRGSFGQQRPAVVQGIGVGDVVQIVVWEAAAGGLFSAPASDRLSPGSRSAVIPEQAVGRDGAVTVPYAGRIRVVGRTPEEVEQEVVNKLANKAVEPQALVTVTKNVANTVTVIGEVTLGARVPLTSRGDRILDVIAQAGGTKAPAYETFLTLMRDGRSVRVPLQAILSDPAENVFVRPGDVISVAREPQSFTSAGATGKNSVVPFEAVGITLEQAIAHSGGLSDQRADPAGVFVIRFERPLDYDKLGLSRPQPGDFPQVPVIYRINMRDPGGFFLARRFPIRNKDILFVSNAPVADLQKVMGIVWGFVGAAATVVGVTALSR